MKRFTFVCLALIAVSACAAAEAPEQSQESGRIEVQVMIGGQPRAGEHVILKPDVRFGALLSEDYLTGETNSEGRHVFDDLPPGPYLVGWWKRVKLFMPPNSFTYQLSPSHRTGVLLGEGESRTIQVGGTGRPVIGRLVAPSDLGVEPAYRSISIGRLNRALDPPTAPEGLTEEEAQAWQEAFHASPEGLAYRLQVAEGFAADIEEDGSFRFDDVPAGAYSLHIDIDFDASGEPLAAYASGKIEVPAPPGGVMHSDEPYDAGKFEVQLRSPSGQN